jgi:hypothetical protein
MQRCCKIYNIVRLKAFATLVALLLISSWEVLWAQPSANPSEKALALVRELRARRMDVDRSGNLWTWDGNTGQVQLYSPGGGSLVSTRVPRATAVDVDREWGVAGIVADGFELRILPFGQAAPLSIRLRHVSHGVAWIDGQTVAVAPALAGHRIEIRRLPDGTVLREIGTEDPIEPKPGLTVLRTVDLDYDPKRELLFTTESFSGDVQIFSLDGKLLRRESLPLSEERRSFERSLAASGEEARKNQDAQTPAIWWFHQAVDASGTAWFVVDCDRKNRKATFFKIPLQGTATRVTVDEPCCHSTLALWGPWLVLYSSPATPQELCNSVRKLP